MALKYQRAKGTHDVYPGASEWADDSDRWRVLEDTFHALCADFGYGEIRTPIFEATDLFTRSIGAGTDIVSKEMYSFETKGGDWLTLRPESTAPVLRAYVENGLFARGGTTKLFYIAPHFRYERAQKGRYRQHVQAGVEALGADDPALDAEVISLALAFYRRIGISNLVLKLNSVGSSVSRTAYVQELQAFVAPHLAEFSAEGQARFVNNPLRMLDTKNARELEILADAPQLSKFLLADEQTHFERLCGYLDDMGVAYELDPYLVRGFDYYTKTAFEIQSSQLGAGQNALGGGGRYDTLVEELGGPPTPGIGFGLGLERALIVLQALNVEMPLPPAPLAFAAVLGDAARPVAVKLLAELREGKIAADMDYTAKNLKTGLRAAARARAQFALIIGDDEIARGVVQCKNLADGTQATVALGDVATFLAARNE